MERLKFLATAIIVTFLVLVIGVFVYLAIHDQLESEFVLPLIIVGGIVCLLVILVLAAVVFAKVELANKDEALGLPAGSVRAVIALGLLVAFSILAVYLYQSLAKSELEVKTLTVQTAAELTNLKANSNFEIVAIVPSTGTEPLEGTEPLTGTEPPTGTEAPTVAKPPTGTRTPTGTTTLTGPKGAASGPYLVYYQPHANRDAAEFAKQILTLLGTLLTAVSSFYFGSRAVQDVTSPGGSPKVPPVGDPNAPPVGGPKVTPAGGPKVTPVGGPNAPPVGGPAA